jgi:hypothetical protein
VDEFVQDIVLFLLLLEFEVVQFLRGQLLGLVLLLKLPIMLRVLLDFRR